MDLLEKLVSLRKKVEKKDLSNIEAIKNLELLLTSFQSLNSNDNDDENIFYLNSLKKMHFIEKKAKDLETHLKELKRDNIKIQKMIIELV